ncbi:MAG TPA: DUF4013 domain-containing protein [Methanocorpusculum sp.]|nr:DUF4013 domain-containing protein [Methanocorpusculum sp.]
MSVSIIKNLESSLSYAFENTFKKLGRWLGLSVLLVIPILNLIPYGIFLKIYRDEAPDFSNAGKSFVQGLLYFVISMIYLIIPLILIIVSSIIAAIPDAGVSLVSSIILFAAALIILLLISLILSPAVIKYARSEKFTDAFKLGEIFAMISKAGWGKYIISIIVIIIVSMLLTAIPQALSFIPTAGIYICFILSALIEPFLTIFEFRFLGNLFEKN